MNQYKLVFLSLVMFLQCHAATEEKKKSESEIEVVINGNKDLQDEVNKLLCEMLDYNGKLYKVVVKMPWGKALDEYCSHKKSFNENIIVFSVMVTIGLITGIGYIMYCNSLNSNLFVMFSSLNSLSFMQMCIVTALGTASFTTIIGSIIYLANLIYHGVNMKIPVIITIIDKKTGETVGVHSCKIMAKNRYVLVNKLVDVLIECVEGIKKVEVDEKQVVKKRGERL